MPSRPNLLYIFADRVRGEPRMVRARPEPGPAVTISTNHPSEPSFGPRRCP